MPHYLKVWGENLKVIHHYLKVLGEDLKVIHHYLKVLGEDLKVIHHYLKVLGEFGLYWFYLPMDREEGGWEGREREAKTKIFFELRIIAGILRYDSNCFYLMYKFLSVILLFISFSALAQSNEKIKAGAVSLIDSETNWTYILDSSHKKITAFNEHRDSVWSTFVIYPEWGNCTDSIWSIEITNEVIWVGQIKHIGDKIILIDYESSCSIICSGDINLKSGKFNPSGCD